MDNLFRNMFLQTLNTSKNNILATTDRDNNEEFYKYEPEAPPPASGVDLI